MEFYNLGLLSKKRDTVYAITIIWLIFFHSTFELNWKWFWPLAQIKNIGSIGVDIFLLQSGISLFFSISKYSHVSQFYKKRLKRILVPALLVGIPYFLIKDFSTGEHWISKFFLDLSGISFFTIGLETVWFIVAILIMYFVYPWLYKLFKKTNWSVFCLAACIIVYELFNISFKLLNKDIWNNIEMLMNRVPIFIIGTYVGKFVNEKKILKIKEWQIVAFGIISIGIIVAVKLFLPLYALRISFTVFALPIAMFFSILGKIKYTEKVSAFLSSYTLELYLIHEKTVELFTKRMYNYHYIIINVCAIVLAFVLVIILKKIETLVFKIMDNHKREKELPNKNNTDI